MTIPRSALLSPSLTWGVAGRNGKAMQLPLPLPPPQPLPPNLSFTFCSCGISLMDTEDLHRLVFHFPLLDHHIRHFHIIATLHPDLPLGRLHHLSHVRQQMFLPCCVGLEQTAQLIHCGSRVQKRLVAQPICTRPNNYSISPKLRYVMQSNKNWAGRNGGFPPKGVLSGPSLNGWGKAWESSFFVGLTVVASSFCSFFIGLGLIASLWFCGGSMGRG
eukprot:1828005-Amphidinium_carterae.1